MKSDENPFRKLDDFEAAHIHEIDKWISQQHVMYNMDVPAVVSAVLATMFVAPFFQSIASSAGKDAWKAAKRFLEDKAVRDEPEISRKLRELPAENRMRFDFEDSRRQLQYVMQVNRRGTRLILPQSQISSASIELLPDLDYEDPHLFDGSIEWHDRLKQWLYQSHIKTRFGVLELPHMLVWDIGAKAWEEIDACSLYLSTPWNSQAFWLAVSYANVVAADILRVGSVQDRHRSALKKIMEVVGPVASSRDRRSVARELVALTGDKVNAAPYGKDSPPAPTIALQVFILSAFLHGDRWEYIHHF
jgi:hypothetical protein